jgi:HlyD family secretion protein
MPSEAKTADLSSLRISRDRKEASGPRRPRWPLVVLAVVFVGAAAAGYLLRNRLTPPRSVETAAAEMTYPSQASGLLTASGYVVAQLKASVASKGTGRLVYLGVEEGDHVQAGQVIARLEDNDLRATLQRQRADLGVARAESSDAARTLERTRRLFESQLVSQAELDVAMARAERITASIASAEAAVSEAAVALEYTRIRAPFDGTVLTKDADVGEIVAPFAASSNSRGAVVTIADMSSLLVEADVSEANITRVKTGQPCEIVLDAYPETRYPGVVHKIVPTADRAKATVLTKVAFKERDERVLPEMSAKVTFLSAETSAADMAAPPRLTVPLAAVVERSGRKVVLVVRAGAAAETPVVTGDMLGDRVEVREGLNAGDVVVLRPGADLVTGARVRPRTS